MPLLHAGTVIRGNSGADPTPGGRVRMPRPRRIGSLRRNRNDLPHGTMKRREVPVMREDTFYFFESSASRGKRRAAEAIRGEFTETGNKAIFAPEARFDIDRVLNAAPRPPASTPIAAPPSTGGKALKIRRRIQVPCTARSIRARPLEFPIVPRHTAAPSFPAGARPDAAPLSARKTGA